MTFQQWMSEVDKSIAAMCGLSSADLADYPFADCFESGEDPQTVARDLLEEEGFPSDCFDED